MDSGEWKVKIARHSELSTLNSPFKQTEVGVIPEDWELLPLGQVTEYIKGFAFRADDYRSHGIRILRVSDTTYDGVKDGEGIYLDIAKANSFRRWALREGDLVVSTVGSKPPMYDSMVGKATYIREKDSGSLLNQNAVILRSKKWSLALQRLLHNHLRQDRYLTHIERIFRGNANQASITLRELFEYRIPLPPTKAEQEAIAEALSDADALVESLEQLIAKKFYLKQGAMQELLRPKDGWIATKLGSLGAFLKGSGVRKDESLSGDLPCVRYGEIYTKHNDYIKAFYSWISPTVAATARRLKSGDVLFAGSGETKEEIGKCVAFVDGIETYAGGDIVILRLEKANSIFLGYYLNTAPINRQKASKGQGDAVVHISSAALADIDLTLPPIEEQTAIATILRDMDAEIAALEKKLAKARQLKQGMMHNLLTGKIRLVGTTGSSPLQAHPKSR